MENSKKRARANDSPPALNGTTQKLKYLLEVEEKRLEIAVKIENKRDIVFPETTVIIHDIIKLEKEIERRETSKSNDTDDDLFKW